MQILKASAALIASILSAPIWLTARILAVLGADRDRLLAWASQSVAPCPGLPGEFFRGAVHARLLKGLGEDCTLSYGTLFSRSQARIGRGSYVGPNCNLGWVEMGEDVLLGSGVHIPSGMGQHDFSDPSTPVRDQGGEFRCIKIGRDSWIGNGAIILAEVGEHCVVGAGAILTRTLPKGAIAAGNPAKIVGWRPGFEESGSADA